ncbi:MarR family winged helix-turn-helix transcriptional regulator [Cupriavidus sp. 2TAF22]|uniref:MarR family winged helix-turn-helix transcriptional regulator n=1 Tax=unclassified Cupriavidus TaxID=2640874 RepID=UPI003F90D5DE
MYDHLRNGQKHLPEMHPDGHALISDNLYFLLAQATTHLERDLQQSLKNWELTATQYYVLDGIAKDPFRHSSYYCALLRLDPGCFTRVLDKFEVRGLIARDRGDTDRRLVRVRLLPAGIRLHADARSAIEAAQAEILAQLSSSEVRGLESLISRFRNFIKESTELQPLRPRIGQDRHAARLA